MNVRRGLFRLWVVFAVIWVGGVAIDSRALIEGTYKPWLPQLTYLYTFDGSWVPSQVPSEARSTFDPKATGPNMFKSIYRPIEFEDMRITLLVPSSKPDDDELRKFAAYFRDTYTRREEVAAGVAKATEETLYTALLPPTVILLLGSALVWAFAGFRRQ